MTSFNATQTFPLNARSDYYWLFGNVTPMVTKFSGIAYKPRCTYAIENTLTGEAYVGSTDDFFYRWRKHVNHLMNENHSNLNLLDAFNEDGIENFVIRILRTYEDGVDIELMEYRDGMEFYGESNLYNYVLGTKWINGQSPLSRVGQAAYKPAKSTLARRAAEHALA